MPERLYQRFDEQEHLTKHDAEIPIVANSAKKKKQTPSFGGGETSFEKKPPSAQIVPRIRQSRDKKHESSSPRLDRPSLKERAAALEKARKALPIWAHASEIRQGLRDKDVMLIVGETGSGKSTQVPQMLVNETWCQSQQIILPPGKGGPSSIGEMNGPKTQRGDRNVGNSAQCTDIGGCIAITEPRKVAAISLAERVAKEMGTPLGSSSPDSRVGFSVRFNQSISPGTCIKFLTEGTLLQEMLRDPWLRKYSIVIVDEVHERSLNTDLLLGFLRQIVAGNRSGRGGVPLKIVIMSATAEMESLKTFFKVGYEHLEQDAISFYDSDLLTAINKVSGGEVSNQTDDGSEWSGISTSDSEDEPAELQPGDAGSGAAHYRPAGPLNYRGFERTRQSTLPPTCTDDASPEGFQPKMHVEAEAAAVNKTVRESMPPVGTCFVEGRQYPVKLHYTEKPVQNWLDATLRQVFQIHYKEPMPGDILVFLTGQETVESLEKLILEQEKSMPPNVPKLLSLPLFAALPQDAQQAVFQQAPPRTRKIILATNIAETSVTVPGVRFVIDCGKAKIKHFRTRLGLESLLVKPISKSAATQRMGRAGREGPGQCWRLYTEADYVAMQDTNIPEILRCDLSQAILTMQARGICEIYSFPLLDRPKRDAYDKALTHLYQLGALEDSGIINDIGLQMARLPLSASLARTLLAATGPGIECLSEVIDIIACLSVENIFLKTTSEEKKDEAEAARKMLHRREGDHLTLLATIQGYVRENADRKEWCRQCWVSHRALRAVLVCSPCSPHHCQILALHIDNPLPRSTHHLGYLKPPLFLHDYPSY